MTFLWGLHHSVSRRPSSPLPCGFMELPPDPDPDPDPTRDPFYSSVFKNWTEQAKRLIIMLLGEIQQGWIKVHLDWSTVSMVKLLRPFFFFSFLYLIKDEQLNIIHSLGYWTKSSSLMDMCVKSGFFWPDWLTDQIFSEFFFFFLCFYKKFLFIIWNKTLPSTLTCPTCSLRCKYTTQVALQRWIPPAADMTEAINDIIKDCVNPNLSSRLLPLSFSREWKVHSEKNASTIMGADTSAPATSCALHGRIHTCLQSLSKQKNTFAFKKEGSDRKIN